MIVPVILAGLVSFICTPIVIRIARKIGLTTDAELGTHPAHTHSGVLPRGGGIPIYIGLLVAFWPFLANKIVLSIMLGGAILIIVGLIDDKYGLSPYLRFILNICAAAVAVVGGIGIPFLSNPFGAIIDLHGFILNVTVLGTSVHLLWLADLIAILWIVWCMNMVNWSKGVDGQLPGFVVITAFFLGILALRFSRHDISKELVTMLAFATGASFLGFLPWNFYPQKILPGYGAGSLAGYMLAVLSILSWGKLGTLLLVLSLPLTDAVIVFMRRIKSKKSPFNADRTHFHHSLLDMGWGRRRIAVFYWLVSLVFGIFSLVVTSQTKLFGFVLLIAVLTAIIVWSYTMARSK
ncbi:MAG: undecaprenyl/decaprenyl-phosphate alpha-N-acetylglucosaminyl 1-phosphate transferase [Candidatus Roizmanbacteria bacterium]|nr:undecaprenyl/decaprenyl-phosphate alpha-N-acetylglucosaminyl 1-phosphate transferase [Candidatus Roizmanbacteria bacterium]